MEQKNRFAVYTARPMLQNFQNRKNIYLYVVAPLGRACDVTCTDMAIGREMNNFTLFFLLEIEHLQSDVAKLMAAFIKETFIN